MFSEESEKLIDVKHFNNDNTYMFKTIIFNTYLFLDFIDDEFNDDIDEEDNEENYVDDVDNVNDVDDVNEDVDEEDDEDEDGVRNGHYVNPRRNTTNKIFGERHYNEQCYEDEYEEIEMQKKIFSKVKKPYSLNGKTFILLKNKLFVCEQDYGVLKISSVDFTSFHSQNIEQIIKNICENEDAQFIYTSKNHITMEYFDCVYQLCLNDREQYVLHCYIDSGYSISTPQIIV